MACCGVASLHELTAAEVEAKLGIGKILDEISKYLNMKIRRSCNVSNLYKYIYIIIMLTEQSKDKNDTEATPIHDSINNPTKSQEQKGEKEKSSVNKEIASSSLNKSKMSEKDEINIHPLDSTIHLSVHQKLLPPGRIIHIVRHYQRTT